LAWRSRWCASPNADTGPSAPQDRRYASTYIVGAVCPHEGNGAALVLPFCNTAVINLNLAEIGEMIGLGEQAVLLVDQAGGVLPSTSPCRTTSPCCHCRRNARSSRSWRTSGNSCAVPTAAAVGTGI